SARAAASPTSGAKPTEAPKAASRKLSFKQKFALENLPTKMAEVSAAISKLEDKLADPKFYDKDPKGFAQTIAMIDKERAALAAMEEEWLELEMLREELEG
ncbi:ABC transporter ATP-binding protein, partial [Salmonella enterica subsp. enterica serovar Newport]|nr:ABC transporter ATP-binding protein [Salmonella enterica subsp. enterica serovar Newport]